MNRLILGAFFCVLFLSACKKKDDELTTSDNQPTSFWTGFHSYFSHPIDFCMVATPDSIIHIGRPALIEAVETRFFHKGLYLAPHKARDLPNFYQKVTLMAAGKDSEVFFKTAYGDGMDDIDTYNSSLYYIDSSYKVIREIGYQLRSVMMFQTGVNFADFISLATDNNGALCVGTTGYISSQDMRLVSRITYSADKGNSFRLYNNDYVEGDIRKICFDTENNLYAFTTGNTYPQHLLTGKGPGKAFTTINRPAGDLNDIAPGVNKGELYVATSAGLFLSSDYGSSFTKLNTPAKLLSPAFRKIFVNKKGMIVGEADSLNVTRTDSIMSNCFYSKDKGATWKSLPNIEWGAELRLKGFDPAGRLISTFIRKDDKEPSPYNVGTSYLITTGVVE